MDPAVELEQSLLRSTEDINNAISWAKSDIQKFYENSVVLVTGFSGFLGKQLVEKLLRACKIQKIYLLLRSKKGKCSKERLKHILRDPNAFLLYLNHSGKQNKSSGILSRVFDSIRKTQLNFENRLVIVDGDISSERLGINDDDWKTITDDVSVIFHVAAIIKFDEHIKIAVDTNVRGTREMIQLAKECKNLRSLVYVSTAYCHAVRSRINSEVLDQFYESPVDPEDLIQMVQDQELLADAEGLTKTLIKDWPNTYCFTKAVAEELVRRADGIPACVVRPAIVTGAYKEPAPGWIDKSCLYGASGLILAGMLGIVHTAFMRPSARTDIVPVDYVNNCVIAAGWKTATDWPGRKEKLIYTLACGRKQLLNSNASDIMRKVLIYLISPQTASPIFFVQTPFYIVYLFLSIFLHFIPGAFVDAVALLKGQKPRLLQIYLLNWKIQKSVSYFTTNGWIFKDDNTLSLINGMSKMDKQIFNFDIYDIIVTELFSIWFVGMRKYILKDELTDTKLAVNKQNDLKFKIVIICVFIISIFVLRLTFFLLFSYKYSVGTSYYL